MLQFLDDIIKLIDDSISDEADTNITAGNIIKSGYDSEIDESRDLIQQSEKWISEYQKKLISTTNISTLKIKFSSAQGYFIEIPHSQSSKILETFIPRQSLTSVSRYTTSELRDFES
ncbi:DNA mismatch repair protein MutS, partial [Candidatus Gracilibacteria bacterium]|nr:DNA mismatch repair protein MutS [Candidatus Gracilibacteria bacterium]